MTPERHRKAGQLYHAAMEVEPERAAFLDEVCDGDAESRRDVESLLTSYNDESVITWPRPPWRLPRASSPSGESIARGQSFGHYRVSRYRGRRDGGSLPGRDTRLGRKVALKLLPQIH